MKDLNGLITPSNIILTQMVGENPWHKSPLTQFVTVLDGAWYVNTTDGDSIVMERGHVLFQEDSEANPVGAEHYSGSAFEHPCNQMVYQHFTLYIVFHFLNNSSTLISVCLGCADRGLTYC